MAERTNFLIAYGERLATDLAAPTGGVPKKHPYSFGEARRRLSPKVKSAAKEMSTLENEVCPGDQAVALVTLHPTYLAKTYYPADLLKTYGLDTVGSRAREVSPEKWTRKKPPESAVTSELFVAGPRRRFQQLASDIDRLQETNPGASDLIKIEDFRVQPTAEKLKPLQSKDKEPLLEVILHANSTADHMMLRMIRTLRIHVTSPRIRPKPLLIALMYWLATSLMRSGPPLPKSSARIAVIGVTAFRPPRALLVGR